METLNTYKFIIEGFEKAGLDVTYTYETPEDCDEICLTVEVTKYNLNDSLKDFITDYVIEQYGSKEEAQDDITEIDKIWDFIQENGETLLIWE